MMGVPELINNSEDIDIKIKLFKSNIEVNC